MTRRRIRNGMFLVASAPALLLGCTRSRVNATSGAVSPGLTQDTRRHGHSGTNPNAPFTLQTRSPAGSSANSPATLTSDGAAPPCSAEQLGVVEVAAQVNGDQRFVSLAFVNNGDATCELGGYPSLSLLDDKGAAIGSVSIVHVDNVTEVKKPAEAGQPVAPAPSAGPINLTLAPKGEAYFGISWMSGENCPSVSSLVIDAPGLTRSFAINHSLTVCSGEVKVTALRPTQGVG